MNLTVSESVVIAIVIGAAAVAITAIIFNRSFAFRNRKNGVDFDVKKGKSK